MAIEQFAKPRRQISDVRNVEEFHCRSVTQEMYPVLWFNFRAWHWCVRYSRGIGIVEWLVLPLQAKQQFHTKQYPWIGSQATCSFSFQERIEVLGV